MPYPPRTTVRRVNPGTFQLNPTEGAKLFQSSLYIPRFGLGEFLPTNSISVGEPPDAPRLNNELKSVPELPQVPPWPNDVNGTAPPSVLHPFAQYDNRSPPALNAWAPRVQLNVSDPWYMGLVMSRRLALLKGASSGKFVGVT